jgi:hypothetical protein
MTIFIPAENTRHSEILHVALAKCLRGLGFNMFLRASSSVICPNLIVFLSKYWKGFCT